MFRFTQLFLLIVVNFINSSFALSEIIGGHDRQQLALLARAAVIQHYQQYPLQLHLPDLPLALAADSGESLVLKKLLVTLAEEGVIQRQSEVSRQNQDNKQLIQRMDRFSWPTGKQTDDVIFGIVFVGQIQNIRPIEVNSGDPSVYEIVFQWSLQSPVEWLWAPRLNGINDIEYLRQSSQRLQLGNAQIVWSDDLQAWVLKQTPNLRP